MGAIKVLVIEDNDVFRETLELLFGLRPELEVVGSLADGQGAAALCREREADVVVLDYRLAREDAVSVAREVRASCPRVGIICLTGAASEAEIDELRAAGVAETLTKDEGLDRIVDAVQRAAGELEEAGS